VRHISDEEIQEEVIRGQTPDLPPNFMPPEYTDVRFPGGCACGFLLQ